MYVLTTNGDKGWSKNTSMTSEQLAVIRYNEQAAAAQVLGVKTVQMLDYEVQLPTACMPIRVSATHAWVALNRTAS